MAGFIFKLQSVLTSQSGAKSADAQIASLMLQNINTIHKDITISQLAKQCYTSVSSISRFATNLGYDSFNEMKNDYIGILAEYDDLRIDNSYLNNHTLNAYSDKIYESFCAINDRQLRDDALWLTKKIYEHDNIFIIATHIPSNIMSILHRAVLATGKYIEFIPDRHDQIEKAKHASADDFFIFVSLGGMLVMEKDISIPIIMSDAKKVLITQNENVKFASNFDHVIPLGNQSEDFTAKYKLMLFVDYFINIFFNYTESLKEES